MGKVNGTVVAQLHWNGVWKDYGTGAAYAGTNYHFYYPYILKFTAPEFTGVSQSVEISLGITMGDGETPTLRWALCTSDANKDKYLNTHGAVTDENQIASGTVTTGKLSTMVTIQSLTIETSGIKSGQTYYLFLWGYASQNDPEYCTINETRYHSVTVSSIGGLVHVKKGGTWRTCYAVVKVQREMVHLPGVRQKGRSLDAVRLKGMR